MHAAIALSDAVTIKLSGKKSSGDGQYDIIDLLKRVTPPSANKSKSLDQFKKLIDQKIKFLIMEIFIIKRTSINY